MRRHCAAIFWSLVLAVPLLARHDTAGTEKAIEIYHEGLRLAQGGEYTLAIGAFKQANRLSPSFARAYARIVWAFQQTNESYKAREYFEGLIADSATAPYGHYGLALFHIQQRQFPEAEGALKQSIELAPQFTPAYTRLVALSVEQGRTADVTAYLNALLQPGSDNASAHYGLGYLVQQERMWAKSLEHLNRANVLLPGLWEVLDAEFFAYYRTDRFQEALGVLDTMLRKAEQSGHLEWKSHVMGRIGAIHADLANYLQAIPALEQAIAIARDLGDRVAEQSFQGQLGLVYLNMAKYRDAFAQCSAALDLARRNGDRVSEGRNLGILASIHGLTAEYPQAIEAYQRGIELARQSGDRASEADLLAHLALVYSRVGYHSKALENLQTAIAAARAIKNPWLEGRFLQALGQVHQKLERYSEALQAHDRALIVARRIGDRLGEAARLAYGAEVRVKIGHISQARERYEQALTISRATGAALVEARVLNDLGNLDLRAGRSTSALANFEKAMAAGTASQMPEVMWQARAGMAAACEKRGELARARDHYKHAIESIERVRANLGIAEEKAGFLEDKVQVYNSLIGVLVRLHHKQPDLGYDAEAFQYVERARARSALDLMAEAQGKIEAGIDPSLLDRQREIHGRLARLQSQLIQHYSELSRDAGKIAGFTVALDRADEEYRSFRREIRTRNPRYADFRYPEPLSLAETKRLLPEKALLLEYSLGENASYLFAVTRNDHLIVRLPAASSLALRIIKLREAISARPDRATLSNYWLLAQSLYRDLIGPAGRLISGCDELIIAADGMLHYLPFDALLKPSGEEPGQVDPARLPYLVRDYAVSYIPSASVLATVRRHREALPKPERMFLAYADPRYGGIQSSHGTRSFVNEASIGKLARLEHSRKEVERVASVYSPNDVNLFLGERATEENVKKQALDNYRIVHFAAHGILNEKNPQFSGLVLSRPEANKQEDGLLQTYEIFNLKLNADLVVLSACQTGLGKAVKGEGLVGLTQAFLYAGASTAAVSMWNVDDRSTAELMIRFHRHMQRGNLSKAQALRHAQLDLVGKTDFAHPYYWAPFVLIGDSQRY